MKCFIDDRISLCSAIIPLFEQSLNELLATNIQLQVYWWLTKNCEIGRLIGRSSWSAFACDPSAHSATDGADGVLV